MSRPEDATPLIDPETTLPPATETDATLPPVLGATVDARAPAGYLIDRELGRGGMGVVYLARNLKLDRLCALKMILSGAHAGQVEAERFRTEAQAVARLNHPGIVQVYEVGDHDGRPFMALEFCPGGSLADKLAKNPLSPHQAAELVRHLAEAVHTAHTANVLHRDLKPANVLLDAQGRPKVTDFGLAKKLDEQGGTRTGSVMGTPSYMPPEQANGTKDVGPAADIYALGAILYECLTGRPPFRAATPLDTLLQVLADEPVPLRQLNAGVPRDLETIAHKCLQKDPARRYASAQALADDLGRFLGGEPIAARPVGTVERAVRWVRRNPVVAALAAAVVLVLTAGAVVSAAFAVLAERRATAEAAARAEALANEKAAQANEQKAVAAQRELEKTTDELLSGVVRSLLRPLVQVQVGQAAPLSAPEIEALEELAATKTDKLRLRFLEEAVRTPAGTRQLRSREAAHAALGLDLRRRQMAEALVLARLDAAGLSEEHQTDLALVLAMLGPGPRAAKRAADLLVRAIGTTKDAEVQRALAEGLAALAARMEAGAVVQALGTTPYWGAAQALARAAVARLEPRAVAQAMGTTTHPAALEVLARKLMALAERLDPREAAAVAASLPPVDPAAHPPVAGALAALAARMEPKEGAEVLRQARGKTKPGLVRSFLGQWLGFVTARLEPKEAAEALRQALEKKDAAVVETLVRELSIRAALLKPVEAADVAGALLQGLVAEGPLPRGALAEGLAAVAARLPPDAAGAACAEAADRLVQTLGTPAGRSAASPLARGLAAVADRLQPEQASAVAADLLEALRTAEAPTQGALAKGLAAVAARLPPGAADAVCAEAADRLVQTLGARKLSPPESGFYELAEGLRAVAARLQPREADPACARAADGLVQALGTTPRETGLVAFGLVTVAARLQPGEAARVLVQGMGKTKNLSALRPLVDGLATLAARLKPQEATDAFARASDVLFQIMRDNTFNTAFDYESSLARLLRSLAESLGAVATRNGPEVAEVFLRALGTPAGRWAARPLAQGLVPVVASLKPEEADALCARLVADLLRAAGKPTDHDALRPPAWGLRAVADRLRAEQMAALAAALLRALDRPDADVRSLAEGLKVVGERLAPEEAGKACARVADVLLRRVETLKTDDDRHYLVAEALAVAEALEAGAARLRPEEAAVIAADLVRALDRTTNPRGLRALAQALSAVGARLPPAEAAAVARDLLRSLGKPTVVNG